MFVVVPVIMITPFSSNNATPIDPAAGNVDLLILNTNFMHLKHQADLQIKAKIIVSTQPFKIAKPFQKVTRVVN